VTSRRRWWFLVAWPFFSFRHTLLCVARSPFTLRFDLCQDKTTSIACRASDINYSSSAAGSLSPGLAGPSNLADDNDSQRQDSHFKTNTAPASSLPVPPPFHGISADKQASKQAKTLTEGGLTVLHDDPGCRGTTAIQLPAWSQKARIPPADDCTLQPLLKARIFRRLPVLCFARL
jgi:hypothetical protein